MLATRTCHLEEDLWLEKEAHLAQEAATEGLSQHWQESDEKAETSACRAVKLKGKQVPRHQV